MTFNDLAAQALLEIGALAQGELPTAAETQQCLTRANFMLEGWSAEQLMIFTIQRQVFSLTAGQQTYTMGTGGNFNVPRPAKIERVGIINLGNPVQPLEIPIEYLTYDQWSMIPVKNIQSALPLKVWDDGNFPLRTLSYWCVPNVAVQTAIYTWSALTQFPDLSTDTTYPPGYAEALIYNLAVRMAPSFGIQQVNPVTAAAAVGSISRIKTMNSPIIDLYCDPALLSPKSRTYNWLTDQAASGSRGR